jgi:hypothetical protein
VLYKREPPRPFLIIVFFLRLHFLGISDEEIRIEGKKVLKPVKAPLKIKVVDF